MWVCELISIHTSADEGHVYLAGTVGCHGAGVTSVCKLPYWVLGTKYGPSGRAVSVLNHCVVSPALIIYVFWISYLIRRLAVRWGSSCLPALDGDFFLFSVCSLDRRLLRSEPAWRLLRIHLLFPMVGLLWRLLSLMWSDSSLSLRPLICYGDMQWTVKSFKCPSAGYHIEDIIFLILFLFYHS